METCDFLEVGFLSLDQISKIVNGNPLGCSSINFDLYLLGGRWGLNLRRFTEWEEK